MSLFSDIIDKFLSIYTKSGYTETKHFSVFFRRSRYRWREKVGLWYKLFSIE